MDVSLVATLAGTVASFVSLVVAIVQTVRLRELRRRTNADVWLSISVARTVIQKIEAGKGVNSDPKIREVYGKVTDLFRHLVKQAVLDEHHFTEDTIRRWRIAGKLTSPWQEEQARVFLATADIGDLARDLGTRHTAEWHRRE